ncbi:unnamed protein product [Chrysodeixis includens]|uniref:Uncharacterized protein n=1 Tax=Chrysodeixis includens TaxID=689277 RepID=A0A9P0BUK1_CHRIL|nr:unnamed protein product [Chrysodeixis includens]
MATNQGIKGQWRHIRLTFLGNVLYFHRPNGFQNKSHYETVFSKRFFIIKSRKVNRGDNYISLFILTSSTSLQIRITIHKITLECNIVIT